MSTNPQPTSEQPQQSDQIVDLTQAAATKLKAVLADKDAPGIRIGVSGGGCAGLQYDLAPADEVNENDLQVTLHGVTLFIHPMVLPYIKGTQLDFSDSLMEGGFKFHNPNASSSCGCGTSFGI